MGYVEETGAAQHFRDARITTIYEGTTAIQANDLLGRKLLRDKGAEASKLMAEMRSVAKALSAHSHADLQTMGKKLESSIAALERAVTWTLSHYAANPAAAFMSSYPLLKCFGVVCGAWMLGRSSLIAAQHLAEGSADPFYAQKIAVSLFYTHHVLSGAAGLAETVCEGDSAMRAAELGLNDSLEAAAPAAAKAA